MPIWKFVLTFFTRSDLRKLKYKASICAIFKDESPYLKEWIEFHLLVGFDHFYLFNNNSSDNYRETLKPYIESGVVTLIDWKKEPGQMDAYAYCAKQYKNETKWIAFIDLDEFVVPIRDDNIKTFLSRFENRPFVLVYWKLFGASGRVDRSFDGLVTEDFFVSSRKMMNIGKCFYNTSFNYSPETKLKGYMHIMYTKILGMLIPPVNEFDHFSLSDINFVSKKSFSIQINHYVTKSYGEYELKKGKRGGGVHVSNFHNLDYFFYHNLLCTIPDFSTYKFLVQLKLRMKNQKE